MDESISKVVSSLMGTREVISVEDIPSSAWFSIFRKIYFNEDFLEVNHYLFERIGNLVDGVKKHKKWHIPAGTIVFDRGLGMNTEVACINITMGAGQFPKSAKEVVRNKESFLLLLRKPKGIALSWAIWEIEIEAKWSKFKTPGQLQETETTIVGSCIRFEKEIEKMFKEHPMHAYRMLRVWMQARDQSEELIRQALKLKELSFFSRAICERITKG